MKKIAAKDADQYMLRLPPGLRDRVARRAAKNGRSMNTEIVEAIEQHLTGADRVTQLWELFGNHQENIEVIPWILAAVAQIEDYLHRSSEDFDTPAVLRNLAARKREDAHIASLPLVTADQVQKMKAFLEENNMDEKKFLVAMQAPRIEDIRGFERAMDFLESVIARRRTAR
jgi:plasmid stability protein